MCFNAAFFDAGARMSSIATGFGIVALVEPCPPADELRRRWLELEGAAEPSFFLSWSWIGTLVGEFGPPPMILTALSGGRVVGLALLGRVKGWGLRRPSLHLNETGDPGRDGVMIEYNGILAERGLESKVEAACLSALLAASGWRELHLGGIGQATLEAFGRGGPLRVIQRSPAPYADLAGARDDVLAPMSRNTRQQIRRAMRLYEERGPLSLERARTVDEALDWLDGLEALHTPYWHSRGKPGAFATPSFRPFHRRLIAAAHPHGAVDLLRVSADGQVVGMLYNFRYRDSAYSYQSGFRYETDARLKPGLVAHTLAMQDYAGQGLSRYRFLAGDSRYKASLASASDQLAWAVLQRDSWLARAEFWLRARRRAGIVAVTAE
jgi:CelD/BcsL family acetyltransferase involved in cellulose biosynthesis